MVANRQSMTIRLTYDRYEWLRTMAFQHRIPMQRIIDEAIDLLRHTPDWAETLGDESDTLEDRS